MVGFQRSTLTPTGQVYFMTVRDFRVIALVSSAHFLSHFFQLVLPPLFPLLRSEFGVTYVALGLLMTVFYSASAVGQTISGFLVDRFGARPVLLGGLSLFAGAIALVGLAGWFWMLVPVMLVAGLGNSVFHPADYSIFNAVVQPRRLGRAYSIHGISGSLGWAAAPVVVGSLTSAFGWRVAVVSVGGFGLAVALFLASQEALVGHRRLGAAPADRRSSTMIGDVRLLLAAPILMAFGYFALLSASMSGIQTFSVTALVAIYAVPLALASSALTAYLLGSAGGLLLGGFLADRTSRHDLVAASGMLVAAVLTVGVASGAWPAAALAAGMALMGFCKGATNPSRDLLVRAATPVGSSGKVFGFVYSGLDLGALAMPPVYGWLLDHGEPRAIFMVAAGLMVLTIVTVLQVRRRTVSAPARSSVPASS